MIVLIPVPILQIYERHLRVKCERSSLAVLIAVHGSQFCAHKNPLGQAFIYPYAEI